MDIKNINKINNICHDFNAQIKYIYGLSFLLSYNDIKKNFENGLFNCYTCNQLYCIHKVMPFLTTDNGKFTIVCQYCKVWND